MPGWSRPGFDDSGWQRAALVKPPGGTLEAQMLEPIRVTEVLKPVAMTNPRPGIFMVDFGQSFYGSVRLKVSGPAGTRGPDAHVVQRDARRPAQRRQRPQRPSTLDIYTLKGQGVETWHPRFKGNATRFAQVEGFPGTPTADNFEGLVTHTDMEPVGQFDVLQPLDQPDLPERPLGHADAKPERADGARPRRADALVGTPGQDLRERGIRVQRRPLLRPLPPQLPRASGRGRQPARDPAPVLDVQLQGHHLAQHHHRSSPTGTTTSTATFARWPTTSSA